MGTAIVRPLLLHLLRHDELRAISAVMTHALTDPLAPASAQIEFEDFMKVDIRIGTIIHADIFPQARKPSLKLSIDFGGVIGVKKSSAQITEHYAPGALIGRKVAAVVNFTPRQIGPMMSEVLTLGFPDHEGHVVLFAPDHSVPNGARLF